MQLNPLRTCHADVLQNHGLISLRNFYIFHQFLSQLKELLLGEQNFKFGVFILKKYLVNTPVILTNREVSSCFVNGDIEIVEALTLAQTILSQQIIKPPFTVVTAEENKYRQEDCDEPPRVRLQ